MFYEFLEELERKNIKISFRDGEVHYSGPEEHVTPELVHEIKKYRSDLTKKH